MYVRAGVIAIADVHALHVQRVAGLGVDPARRAVGIAHGPALGQAASRAGSAVDKLGHRLAAALSGQAHVKHRADAVRPGALHGRAAEQNHTRVGICFGHGLYHAVHTVGQAHIVAVKALGLIGVGQPGKDYGRVRPGGGEPRVGEQLRIRVPVDVTALGVYGVGQIVYGLGEPERVYVAGARALVADVPRHMAYHGQARPGLEREHVSVVFQKHRSVAGRAASQLVVRAHVEHVRAGQGAAGAASHRRDAARAFIYVLGGQFAGLGGLQCRPLAEVVSAGHVQVAAGSERRSPVVHGAPVGDHHAVKAPLVAEYVRQQAAAVAAIFAVHLVVRAHDRAGTALADGDLERRQVNLPQCALVYDAVGDEPLALLRICRIVLQAGADARALHPAYERGGKLSGQVRVFAVVFKVTSAQRAALYIDAGAEHHPHAVAQSFLAYRAAYVLQQSVVPRAGQRHRGRKARGRSGRMDAEHVKAAAVLLPAQPVWAVAHEHGRYVIALH